MLDVLQSALVGGLIIGSTKLASQIIGPEYASMVGGVPTGIIASYFISTRKAKKKYFLGYLIDVTVIILSTVITALFVFNHTNWSPSVFVYITLTSWIVFSVISVKMVLGHKDIGVPPV